MKTGFLFHEKYMWHNTGLAWGISPHAVAQPLQHPESPESKRRFRNLYEVSELKGQLVELTARAASEEDLLRVHTLEHINHMKELSNAYGGEAGYDTIMGSGSFEIACLSAGGVMASLDVMMQGEIDNAYALVRPPGHHALADKAFGFCLFNNIAVASRYAQATYGLKKIAVIDWDVHHGNGTESIFYNDSSVLTISLHQDDKFPTDSGAVADVGESVGFGYNLNIPLPAGSGHGAYIHAFEEVVIPALKIYEPELIMVASGFDASYFDPLGRMMAYSETYRDMTKMLMDVAADYSQNRLLCAHEGGYSEAYVPFCGLAVLEALSGLDSAVPDPYLEECKDTNGQALMPHQQEAVGEARASLSHLKKL